MACDCRDREMCGSPSDVPTPMQGTPINDWNALQTITPCNPQKLIKFASIENSDGTPITGAFEFSSSILSLATSPASWTLNSLECNALATESNQRVADAAQWNFQHKACNPTFAMTQLRNKMFVRSGIEWSMRLEMALSLSPTDFYLTFMNNLATRGDNQGTVPVIAWRSLGSLDALNMNFTVVGSGSYRVALFGGASETFKVFEMEWEVTP